METMLAKAKRDQMAGKFQRAAEKYRRILETDPENALAHQGLAECLNSLGQYEEAAEECNRALELDPELAIPYAVLGGGIYYRQQRFEEGEAALRRAIELDPALEEAYVSLGITLSKQERLQEAVDALQKALEVNPKRSLTYYNLGVVYIRQKRYSNALRETFRAFKLGPSIQTGKAVIWVGLRWLAEHPALFYLSVMILAILPVVLSSFLAIPLAVLIVGLLAGGVWWHFRAGNRTTALVQLLLTVAVAALYAYDILFGL
jgi:tetratricopeptide (TPR) repeat protein